MQIFFLSIGSFLLLVISIYFLSLARGMSQHIKVFSYSAAFITGIASIFYLVMAIGAGHIVLPDGNILYFARYFDWAITTPLIVITLCSLAVPRFKNLFSPKVATAVFLDILMIATGFLATIYPVQKYMWFAISSLCFLGLLFLLLVIFRQDVKGKHPMVNSLYRRVSLLIILLWSIYPVIWFLSSAGISLIDIETEVALYALCDIFAKGVFGYFLLSDQKALELAVLPA